jgi:hypothetical protein
MKMNSIIQEPFGGSPMLTGGSLSLTGSSAPGEINTQNDTYYSTFNIDENGNVRNSTASSLSPFTSGPEKKLGEFSVAIDSKNTVKNTPGITPANTPASTPGITPTGSIRNIGKTTVTPPEVDLIDETPYEKISFGLFNLIAVVGVPLILYGFSTVVMLYYIVHISGVADMFIAVKEDSGLNVGGTKLTKKFQVAYMTLSFIALITLSVSMGVWHGATSGLLTGLILIAAILIEKYVVPFTYKMLRSTVENNMADPVEKSSVLFSFYGGLIALIILLETVGINWLFVTPTISGGKYRKGR